MVFLRGRNGRGICDLRLALRHFLARRFGTQWAERGGPSPLEQRRELSPPRALPPRDH